MGDDKERSSDSERREHETPVAGYAAESKSAADQRAATGKFGRHATRVLPSPITLRNEYRKLASDPKCGKRGAIGALAKKYKTSQSAVRKVLEHKSSKPV